MTKQPFAPIPGATLSVATVAGAAAIPNINPDGEQLLIVNAGTQLVQVRLTRANDSANATAADLPILPNTSRVITRELFVGPRTEWFTRLSVFAGAVGSTVYVTPGNGMGTL